MQLSMTPCDAFGRLFLVWRWFDQHTEDGNAPSVTSAYIDHVAGVAGFANAMRNVKWLHGGDDNKPGVSLPHFDYHNGKTSKSRALTAKRVATHKQRNGNDVLTRPALPREEKRRSTTPLSPPAEKQASSGGNGAKRTRRSLPATPCPEEFTVTEPMAQWAVAKGLPSSRVMAETEQFLQHYRAKGQLWHDWTAAWQKWIGKAVEFGAKR